MGETTPEGCSQGTVEGIEDGIARVRLDPAGACASCEGRRGCGVDLSAGGAPPVVHVDAADLAPGERVSVRAPAGLVPGISALLFLLPALALIGGAALGPPLMEDALALSTNAAAGIGALLGLVLALVPAALLESRRRADVRGALIVTRIDEGS